MHIIPLQWQNGYRVGCIGCNKRPLALVACYHYLVPLGCQVIYYWQAAGGVPQAPVERGY